MPKFVTTELLAARLEANIAPLEPIAPISEPTTAPFDAKFATQKP
jgi:hypothetical protein